MIKTVLNETSLKSKAIKLFKNPDQSKIKTFVILTGENPDIKKLTPKENKIQNQKLKDNLKNLCTVDKAINSIQYPYYKIKGCYENNIEHSFLIFNITFEDARYIAATSHQESFIFGRNNNGELTFEFWQNKYTDGTKYSYVLVCTEKSVEDDTIDKNYTKISKKFKFNIPFSCFVNKADEVTEHYNNRGYSENILKEMINNVVSDECNFRYRQGLRIKLYSQNWKEFY